ncbi:MAG: TDT family transporter [Clostridia bacterium]
MLKRLPLPFAGLMLGLAALGNLLASYSEILRLVLGGLSFVCFLLLLLKLLKYPKDIIADLHNPALASIAATFPMGIMILCTYLAAFNKATALAFWVCALIIHIILIIYFTAKFVLHFDIKKVLPSYFVLYVGIAAAAVSAPAVGQQLVGQFAFWFALCSFLVLLPVVTYRVVKIKNIPAPLLPFLAIFTAPAALCLAGYNASITSKSLMLIYPLLAVTCILYLIVLFLLPKLFRPKFLPSFSAFTFPLIISAIAVKTTNALLVKQGIVLGFFPLIITIMTIIAFCLTLYVLYRYLEFLFTKPKIEQ